MMQRFVTLGHLMFLLAMATACTHLPERAAMSHETAAEADAFHRAITAGHRNSVEYWLGQGMDPDIRQTGTGRTPLITAIFAGNADMVDALLHHGANPALADEVGNTPLHIAAQTNQPWLVLRLLQAGAPAGRRNAQGQRFDAYLFLLPDARLTRRARDGRAAVAQWLAAHPPE